MVASVLGFQRGAGGMIEWTMMAFTVCLVAAFSAGGGALLGARMRPDDAA